MALVNLVRNLVVQGTSSELTSPPVLLVPPDVPIIINGVHVKATIKALALNDPGSDVTSAYIDVVPQVANEPAKWRDVVLSPAKQFMRLSGVGGGSDVSNGAPGSLGSFQDTIAANAPSLSNGGTDFKVTVGGAYFRLRFKTTFVYTGTPTPLPTFSAVLSVDLNTFFA